MINKNITFTSEELAVLNDIVKKYIDYYKHNKSNKIQKDIVNMESKNL